MKVYLCATQPQDKTYKWVSNLASFNEAVENSEATSIVCDFFLSTFKYDELKAVIDKIVSKMRLNCELVITMPDINILAQRLVRNEIDIKTMNDILFRSGSVKSVAPISKIEELLPPNLNVTHKHFDTPTSQITIKARRIG